MRELMCELKLGETTQAQMVQDFKQYGRESFVVEVFESCPDDLIARRECELKWMRNLRAEGKLYNSFQISFQPEESARQKGVVEAQKTASVRMGKQHQDPLLKARRIAGLLSDENRKSRSERMRKLWQDPDFAEARLKDLKNGRDRA
jgi:hypothetical protein